MKDKQNELTDNWGIAGQTMCQNLDGSLYWATLDISETELNLKIRQDSSDSISKMEDKCRFI